MACKLEFAMWPWGVTVICWSLVSLLIKLGWSWGLGAGAQIAEIMIQQSRACHGTHMEVSAHDLRPTLTPTPFVLWVRKQRKCYNSLEHKHGRRGSGWRPVVVAGPSNLKEISWGNSVLTEVGPIGWKSQALPALGVSWPRAAALSKALLPWALESWICKGVEKTNSFENSPVLSLKTGVWVFRNPM